MWGFFDGARVDIWCLWNFLSGVNISSNVSIWHGSRGWERSVWSCRGPTCVIELQTLSEPNTAEIIYSIWSADILSLIRCCLCCHQNISAPVIHWWIRVSIVILARWCVNMFVFAVVRMWTCFINMLRLLIYDES